MILSLVRTYFDAEMAHDLDAVARVLDPAFRLQTEGRVIAGRDELYLPMLRSYLAEQPDLSVAVHEVISDGRTAAVAISKLSATPAAVWDAVVIFSAADGLITNLWTEQDWLLRYEQTRGLALVPPTRASGGDVWPDEAPHVTDPVAEQAVHDWLAGGGALDPSGATSEPLLEVEDMQLGTMFTAGDRFAFHATYRGSYLSGLPGCGAHRGSPAELSIAGMGSVLNGRIEGPRLVADRAGLRRRLTRSPAVVTP